jgi:type I restriction enzyme S subunit
MDSMSEWKEYKIFQLGIVVTGKTPSKDSPKDWGVLMPFITPSDYKNYGKKAKSSERNLSEEGIKKLKGKILPKKSLLVTCIGSDMGKVVMNEIEAITNQQINSIIPDNKIVDSDFLYYTIISIYDTLRIYGGDGTAVPIVNKTTFENIELNLPPLSEQKSIASILSSLDDKIDLLQRQNATLEAMAETLFRQWFVEEANNNTISQLITIQNGFAFKSNEFQQEGNHGVIKIKNISGGVIDIDQTDFISEDVANRTPERFKINTGDILIAMTGAEIGKLGIIPKSVKNLWLNQRVGLLKEKFKGAKFLAYLQLKSEFGQDYIENTATGSAQPNISGIAIENCGFPTIDDKLVKEYAIQIGDLYDKIIFNLGQIRTLTTLRDVLLPKLMSGEVRVK